MLCFLVALRSSMGNFMPRAFSSTSQLLHHFWDLISLSSMDSISARIFGSSAPIRSPWTIACINNGSMDGFSAKRAGEIVHGPVICTECRYICINIESMDDSGAKACINNGSMDDNAIRPLTSFSGFPGFALSAQGSARMVRACLATRKTMQRKLGLRCEWPEVPGCA